MATYFYITQTIQKDEQSMLRTAEETRMNSKARVSNGLLHMETSVLADQQKLTKLNSEWTLDTVQRTAVSRP